MNKYLIPRQLESGQRSSYADAFMTEPEPLLDVGRH
jgi:hypothetical protein